MILVNKIINSLFNENTYVVYNSETLEALIIDPGSDFDVIYQFVCDNHLSVLAVLLTHGHFDHSFSCAKFQKIGYHVYISEGDVLMCSDTFRNGADMCGVDFSCFIPDHIISYNDLELNIGSFNIKVVHVPGHTVGGLSYIIHDSIYTGDTLFDNCYGRTDLVGSCPDKMSISVKTLIAYVKNGFVLRPGHDY